MFFNVLARWLRLLFSIAVLVCAVLFIKKWVDELPRAVTTNDPRTGAPIVRPFPTLGERLNVWRADPGRSTGWLLAGALLLLWTLAGRFLSPWSWRRAGRAPRLTRVRPYRLRTPDGHHLYLEEHGHSDLPPILLIHGVGSDRTQWLETIQDLCGRFRVHTIDLVGHGRSSKAQPAEYTIESAAGDLDQVLRHIGHDGLILVGHSMGGMIAMRWCSLYPEEAARIAGLVLVHTTPQDPFTTMKPVRLHRSLQGLYGMLLRITPWISPLLRVEQWIEYSNGTVHWQNALSLFAGTETREQLDRSARLFARHDSGVSAHFTRSMMRFDVRPELRSLDVPTLVVAAAQDRTTMPKASHVIADGIPGARFVELAKARHMGFMERRHEFAGSVASLAERAREPMRRAQP